MWKQSVLSESIPNLSLLPHREAFCIQNPSRCCWKSIGPWWWSWSVVSTTAIPRKFYEHCIRSIIVHSNQHINHHWCTTDCVRLMEVWSAFSSGLRARIVNFNNSSYFLSLSSKMLESYHFLAKLVFINFCRLLLFSGNAFNVSEWQYILQFNQQNGQISHILFVSPFYSISNVCNACTLEWRRLFDWELGTAFLFWPRCRRSVIQM